MAMLNQDLSQVQAQTGREPLPPGEYNVRVTDTAVVTTKSGFPMLKAELTVIDGQMHGRKLFEQYLLNHSDPKVVQIHLSRLKGLATAGGHPHPDMIKDSEELHGLQLTVRVKIKNDPQYGDKNEIGVMKPLPVVQVPTQARMPQPAPNQIPITQCPGCGGGKNPTAHLCPACDSRDEAKARAEFKPQVPPAPPVSPTKPKAPWEK